MFCENCGRRIAPGEAFCPNCGAKIGSGVAPGIGGYGVVGDTYSKGKKNMVGFVGSIITTALMLFLIIVPSQFERARTYFLPRTSFSMLKVFDFMDYVGTSRDEAVFIYLFFLPMIPVLIFYLVHLIKVSKGSKSAGFAIAASVIYTVIAFLWFIIISGAGSSYTVSPALGVGIFTAIACIIFAAVNK